MVDGGKWKWWDGMVGNGGMVGCLSQFVFWANFHRCLFKQGGGKELLNISPSNMRLFKVKGGFLSTLPYFLWFFVRSFPPQKHSRKPRFSFPSPDA